MIEQIESDRLKISVNSKGAELTSLFDKTSGTEYMWSGDPAFWGKHSPVLFPIVGTLKQDTYYYDGKPYQLNRHGFARDSEFSITGKKDDRLVFTLLSNEETLKKFPFVFRFDIIYTLQNNVVAVTYRVSNNDKLSLYFSVGGHPAFKLPVAEGTVYDDYYLEFDKEEDAGRWPISKDGLIEATSLKLLDGKKLPLTKSLFYKDALVFKHLKSAAVSLRSDKTSSGFTFHFKGFPYLGIWAAKDADFVCIEPWCGIADSVNANQDFTQKEGINKLETGGVFEGTWTVELL